MLSSLPSAAADKARDLARDLTRDLARDLIVKQVTSQIVDVPTVRRHKLSSTSITAQNYVIVRLLLANGVEGIGEASTLGGPRWSEGSVEAIKANIDASLGPADRHARRPLRAGGRAARCRRQAQQRRQGGARTA
jgi:muconate cycloisomerase